LSGYGKDDAFFCLGLAYSEGAGVKKSIRTAVQLFERANIDSDHPAARKMLQDSRTRESRPQASPPRSN
jgi:TPR repeat protein